jgi:hypothetical protein
VNWLQRAGDDRFGGLLPVPVAHLASAHRLIGSSSNQATHP